jgi:ferredoxin
MDTSKIVTRKQRVRDSAALLLGSGGVSGVLGLRRVADHVEPYLFTTVDELENLSVSGKYAIAGVARRLMLAWNDEALGVVARGCDERHLIELAKRGGIDVERLKLIGVACTQEEADSCRCERPYPTRINAGEKVPTVIYPPEEAIGRMLAMDMWDKRRYWTDVFNRCIKCYGCRNSCPLCYCDDCRLEESRWVRVGEVPPEFPSFHLIRAFHLADRCIGCGACERACPMGIPLGEFHRLIREEVKRLFDYEAGLDIADASPLLTDLEEDPLKVTTDEL